MSKSTAYSHFCDKPGCRSFTSPRFRALGKNGTLTVVKGTQNEHFAYYSQKKNIMAPYRAPKPLRLVPYRAAAAGFEPDDDKIRLNKATREGSARAPKRNRSREKAGPSKLRFEVSAEDVEVPSPSPPATDDLSSALVELRLACHSHATDAADEDTPASSLPDFITRDP